jgi:hypothetical protein
MINIKIICLINIKITQMINIKINKMQENGNNNITKLIAFNREYNPYKILALMWIKEYIMG